MPIDEQQLLREVREAVAGITVDLARTRDHVMRQTERLSEIRDAVTAMRQRSEDHTGRILLLETETKSHSGWRSKLGGAWIGAGLVITAISSLIALGLAIFKH